jgi:hypothetical protein
MPGSSKAKDQFDKKEKQIGKRNDASAGPPLSLCKDIMDTQWTYSKYRELREYP